MSQDDHARPIPQRPHRGPTNPDDVDVVDTRRRRPSSGGEQAAPPRRTARPARGAQERDAARAPRPPVAPPRPAARVPAARPTAYDEFGRPVTQARPQGPPRTPRPPQRPPQTRGPLRRIRRALSIIVVLLLAYAAFLAYTPWHAWSGVTREVSAPDGERPADSSGHTYLLVGSDSREGMSAEEQKRLGTGSDAGRRTDSIMLVHVPSGGGKSAIISIPRDSYVPIPGHGSNKINAAFSIGGPQLLVETLEQVTDLRIDGYLEIGFAGFANLVDSMGGVQICVPFDMDDPKAHINLKKGCQVLDGPNALGFVRARYSDPRGDIGRAARQRQFLAAIMKQAATPSTVLVPTTWWSTTHSAVDGLVVGEDTSVIDAGRVALAMRGVSKDTTLSLVVPLSSTNFQTPAGSSVKWDTERAKELFRMLREGEDLTKAPDGTDGVPTGG